MLNLLGIGHFHPETVIDNRFLESLKIGTDDQWILERVGIRTRRTVLPLDYIYETRNRDVTKAKSVAQYSASELGARAAKFALERAQLLPKEIGLVVCGASLPEVTVPSQASLIAAKLGIETASIDINAACSSFVAQIDFLDKMRPEALPDYILVVVSETYTMASNYDDRNVAVLFGDGAAAAIFSPRFQGKAFIETTSFGSKPSGHEKVVIPYGKFFEQQGQAVQRFAILQTETTTNDLLESSRVNREETFFIGHQANLRILENATKRIGFSEKNHLFNVDVFGNQGAAGAPIVLSQNWDTFKRNDSVAVSVVGAGLSWGGMMVKFT